MIALVEVETDDQSNGIRDTAPEIDYSTSLHRSGSLGINDGQRLSANEVNTSVLITLRQALIIGGR